MIAKNKVHQCTQCRCFVYMGAGNCSLCGYHNLNEREKCVLDKVRELCTKQFHQPGMTDYYKKILRHGDEVVAISIGAITPQIIDRFKYTHSMSPGQTRYVLNKLVERGFLVKRSTSGATRWFPVGLSGELS